MLCKQHNFLHHEVVFVPAYTPMDQLENVSYCQCHFCLHYDSNQVDCDSTCSTNRSVSDDTPDEGCSICKVGELITKNSPLLNISSCFCSDETIEDCDYHCGGKGLGILGKSGECQICAACKNYTIVLSGEL